MLQHAANMKAHLKAYRCMECGERFPLAKQLLEHIPVHAESDDEPEPEIEVITLADSDNESSSETSPPDVRAGARGGVEGAVPSLLGPELSEFETGPAPVTNENEIIEIGPAPLTNENFCPPTCPAVQSAIRPVQVGPRPCHQLGPSPAQAGPQPCHRLVLAGPGPAPPCRGDPGPTPPLLGPFPTGPSPSRHGPAPVPVGRNPLGTLVGLAPHPGAEVPAAALASAGSPPPLAPSNSSASLGPIMISTYLRDLKENAAGGHQDLQVSRAEVTSTTLNEVVDDVGPAPSRPLTDKRRSKQSSGRGLVSILKSPRPKTVPVDGEIDISSTSDGDRPLISLPLVPPSVPPLAPLSVPPLAPLKEHPNVLPQALPLTPLQAPTQAPKQAPQLDPPQPPHDGLAPAGPQLGGLGDEGATSHPARRATKRPGGRPAPKSVKLRRTTPASTTPTQLEPSLPQSGLAPPRAEVAGEESSLELPPAAQDAQDESLDVKEDESLGVKEEESLDLKEEESLDLKEEIAPVHLALADEAVTAGTRRPQLERLARARRRPALTAPLTVAREAATLQVPPTQQPLKDADPEHPSAPECVAARASRSVSGPGRSPKSPGRPRGPARRRRPRKTKKAVKRVESNRRAPDELCRIPAILPKSFHLGKNIVWMRQRLSETSRPLENNKNLACNLCRYEGTESNMIYHILKHLHMKPYKTCLTCGEGFNKKLDLVIHQANAHDLAAFCCATCGKMFSTKVALKSHITQAHVF